MPVQLKNIDNKINLNDVVGICPHCGRKLIIKEGKYGKFVGCTGYRYGCTTTYNYDTFKVFDSNKLSLSVQRAVHDYYWATVYL